MDNFLKWLCAALIPLHIVAVGFHVYIDEFVWAAVYVGLTVMWTINFKSMSDLVKKRKEVEQRVAEMIIKEMANDNRR